MKKIFLFGPAIVLVFAFSSCKKEDKSCDLLPAKIVRFDCDRVVFSLLTNEVIGDLYWTDVHSGIRYSNVVSYYNTCQIASLTNGRLDTVYLTLKKVNENLYAPDCMQCQALSQDPPSTKIDIISISKDGCPGVQYSFK